MMAFFQDVRYGARLLFRTPGFTLVAVAALAIGIGANTAIFSVVNTLLIQPLPYQDPDRLVMVWEHNLPRDRKNNVVGPANFLHWRDMNQSFDDMAAFSFTFTYTVLGDGEPEEVPSKVVTAAFFPVLGVQPAIGRTFTPDEDKPGSRVLVMSDRLWKRRYNADPNILQRTVSIQGTPYTVLGVMPPGFSFMDKTVDLWAPVGFTQASRTPRGRSLSVIARLKPGVTVARASQDMTRVHAELERMFPDFNTGWTARVVSLKEELTGTYRPALLVLLGAVALVLLIACANVANLLLARSTARQRELAVRAALGAARTRIMRQLMAESLVLAALGGVAGLLMAWWALAVLRAAVADTLPIQRLEAVGIDGWVLAFTVGASVLSGLFFGLIPALTASGSDLTDALKQGGRSGSAARGNRTRGVFVVVEVALALVLLVGAGLLIRSFSRLVHVNPGFDPRGLVTMDVGLPAARYDNPKRIDFFRRLFEQIDRLPGVETSGGISFLPLTGLASATSYTVVGQPVPARGEEPVAEVRVVTNAYFKAMGVPLLKGRLFNEQDVNDTTNRVVVSEALAKKHWANEDPIGRKIRINWNEQREDEIIGVVGDVRHAGLDADPRGTTYWPYPRFPYGTMTVAVRTAGGTQSTAGSVVSIVRGMDPNLAVADVRSMEEVVADSVAERRVVMLMLGIFAAAALLLAAVGIYGVIAYSVTQRTQELGIRMALGAQRGDVLRMVVGQAMVLALVGIAIGAVGALALSRLMEGLLFQVRPADPATFVAVAAVLAAVAALASYLPGRRATRVDPVVALRAE